MRYIALDLGPSDMAAQLPLHASSNILFDLHSVFRIQSTQIRHLALAPPFAPLVPALHLSFVPSRLVSNPIRTTAPNAEPKHHFDAVL